MNAEPVEIASLEDMRDKFAKAIENRDGVYYSRQMMEQFHASLNVAIKDRDADKKLIHTLKRRVEEMNEHISFAIYDQDVKDRTIQTLRDRVESLENYKRVAEYQMGVIRAALAMLIRE